jgi:hypothetical protein
VTKQVPVIFNVIYKLVDVAARRTCWASNAISVKTAPTTEILITQMAVLLVSATVDLEPVALLVDM